VRRPGQLSAVGSDRVRRLPLRLDLVQDELRDRRGLRDWKSLRGG
jgi:hypothetical protein